MQPSFVADASAAAADVSLARQRSSSHSGRTLSTHQAAQLVRDRALQLKLLPSLQRPTRRLLPQTSSWLDKLLPPLFPASAALHVRWLLGLSVLSLVGAFVTPFRLAFLPSGVRTPLAAYELAVDVLFCCNCAVVRLLCVLPSRLPDATRAETAAHYVWSLRMLRDATAALPFDFIAAACGLRNRDALCVLGVLRMRRLRTAFKTMSIFEADQRFNYKQWRLSRLCLYVLIQTHGFACAFAFLAEREGGATWFSAGEAAKLHSPESSSVGSKYLAALYWAAVSFCTVGYGDFTPQTEGEQVFTIVYLYANFALSVFVVGNMSVLSTSADSIRKFREQTSHLERFLRAHHLPAPLAESMRSAMQLQQQYDREVKRRF